MRWMLCSSVLVALAGCHAFHADVDGRIAERAAQSVDVEPALPVRVRPKMLPPTVGVEKEAEQPAKGKQKFPPLLERLEFKKGILGFEVPDLRLPPFDAPPKQRKEAIDKQFPPLPKMPVLPAPQPGPEGQPLTLSELQQSALRTNPLIRQAHQDIQIARGIALQAGLYPNPTVGYESSTIGQGNTDGQRSPGQQGGFVEQTIVTMGKRTLARSAVLRDAQIAEQKLKQVEAEVQTQVRSGYFAVLSARENHRVTKGLAELTDELYDVLLLQMLAGEVAGYEPMQIRVLAMQSRGALVQAHNRYVAAWRQLTAALGTPGMPLTAVAGQIDMPVPHYEHARVLAFVLGNHTEVIAAQLGVEKARFLTRLAEMQPYPDVTLHVAVQKDFTTPPFGTVANVNVGVPFPLWNRNQGNIQAARALALRALDDQARVQNELTAQVAEVFERYENNRLLLDMYKKQILPNQVQAFRAAVARHINVADKAVSYNDVVTSQQTLANLISAYLNVLAEQWKSVVDIANLTQTRDLFLTQPMEDVAPIPDVYEIIHPGLRHRR